jgi:hypothetical protein
VRKVFTDKKHWKQSRNDVQIKENPLKMIKANQRGGLMVWGTISKSGGIHLICMEGAITAEAQCG